MSNVSARPWGPLSRREIETVRNATSLREVMEVLRRHDPLFGTGLPAAAKPHEQPGLYRVRLSGTARTSMAADITFWAENHEDAMDRAAELAKGDRSIDWWDEDHSPVEEIEAERAALVSYQPARPAPDPDQIDLLGEAAP